MLEIKDIQVYYGAIHAIPLRSFRSRFVECSHPFNGYFLNGRTWLNCLKRATDGP